jgi:hypothetical protein
MHLAKPHAPTPLLTMFVSNHASLQRLQRPFKALKPWLLDEYCHASHALHWKRTRCNPARLAKLEGFCEAHGLNLDR